MAQTKSLIPVERIEKCILLIRGQKVMLDEHLAEVYGVTTKRLNEQVRRNKGRFPKDFMLQLTKAEHDALRSQIATSNVGRGGRRYRPYVFTEHGAVMLASVLNTAIAVQASIHVVRAFVRLREMLAGNAELARRLDQLERKYAEHDVRIQAIFDAIRSLMAPPKHRRELIGFKPTKKP